jgi:hypothetical protein
VAKAAARRRRGAGQGSGSGLGRWIADSAGILLIAVSALSALALATYTPSDPLFRLTEVANGAGAVGATVAGVLRRAVGWGAVVLVGVAIIVGGRLVLRRGAPGARFWLGAGALLLALASLPPLLAGTGASSIAPDAGGRLGVWLASGERILLSVGGALFANLLIATGGALALLGIPLGSASRVAIAILARAAAGIAVVAGAAWRASLLVGGAVSSVLGRALAVTGAGAVALAAGLRDAVTRGWQEIRVRRARRARRARAAPVVAANSLDDEAATEIAPGAGADVAVSPPPTAPASPHRAPSSSSCAARAACSPT